jgi:glycosyltransferase involved in cell wall biosynthesis
MTEIPTVSIVLPVYCQSETHKRLLVETLESVAAQTLPNTELVVVDDSSPTDPFLIIKSVPNLPPTRILRNTVNLGHAESRNIGIRAAEGELIAFLDHDDIWLPEKLERQVQALQENPDVAMCYCNVEIIGPRPPKLYVDQRTIPDRPSIVWFLNNGNTVITASSVLVRKQAMLDIGLFDTRYTSCDDYDAWIKILMRWPILHISETLAKYRLHEYNVNYSVNRLNDNRLLTNLILKCWRAAPVSDKIALLPLIARKFAGRAVYTVRRIWHSRKQ